MLDTIDDPASRQEAEHRKQEAAIAVAFLLAVRRAKQTDLETIAAMLAAGNFEGALALLDDVPVHLAAAMNAAYIQSGQSTAAFLTRNGLATVFDMTAPNPVQTMAGVVATTARDFAQKQRAASAIAMLNDPLVRMDAAKQARRFRDTMGLSERDAAAVENYRASLVKAGRAGAGQTDALERALRDKRDDAAVMRAVRQAAPLSDDVIDRMAGRYAENLLRARAKTIGTTSGAGGAGTDEAYRQAAEATGTVVTQTWDTMDDERVRHTHVLLHGTSKLMGEAWQTENGAIRWPRDPLAPVEEIAGCRCSRSFRTTMPA